MRFDVITLFPEMLEALRCGGITARALENDLAELQTWDPRDFTESKHRRVDDRPYGGGPGMVMQVQPLRETIRAARESTPDAGPVIYLSPQGRQLNEAGLDELLQHKRLILVSGRYEGIDERIIERDIDQEWSIGDYVLSGGEPAAIVMIDALVRRLPGVLGHEDSAQEDSFAKGLLDYPHYSRPEGIDEQTVPEVLLTGHHAAVKRWRHKQALGRTWLRRPDLLQTYNLTDTETALLAEFIQEQQEEKP